VDVERTFGVCVSEEHVRLHYCYLAGTSVLTPTSVFLLLSSFSILDTLYNDRSCSSAFCWAGLKGKFDSFSGQGPIVVREEQGTLSSEYNEYK